MTIDYYLAIATLAMGTINSLWLLALVFEIRRHNRERSVYNQRVSTPINATPSKAPPIVGQSQWVTVLDELGSQVKAEVLATAGHSLPVISL